MTNWLSLYDCLMRLRNQSKATAPTDEGRPSRVAVVIWLDKFRQRDR